MNSNKCGLIWSHPVYYSLHYGTTHPPRTCYEHAQVIMKKLHPYMKNTLAMSRIHAYCLADTSGMSSHSELNPSTCIHTDHPYFQIRTNCLDTNFVASYFPCNNVSSTHLRHIWLELWCACGTLMKIFTSLIIFWFFFLLLNIGLYYQ
jgi:hypothetical protein